MDTLYPNLGKKGCHTVVKGTNRQVVLVKSPDPRLFEQAIFILREEALNREGVTNEQILRQARRAADGYLKQGKGWKRPAAGLPGLLVFAGFFVCFARGALLL